MGMLVLVVSMIFFFVVSKLHILKDMVRILHILSVLMLLNTLWMRFTGSFMAAPLLQTTLSIMLDTINGDETAKKQM